MTDSVRSWMRQVKIEFIEDIDLSILDETHDVHLESIPSSKVFSPNESWCNPLLRPRSTATSGSLLSQTDDQIIRDSLGVEPYKKGIEHSFDLRRALNASFDQTRGSSMSRLTNEHEPGPSGPGDPLKRLRVAPRQSHRPFDALKPRFERP